MCTRLSQCIPFVNRMANAMRMSSQDEARAAEAAVMRSSAAKCKSLIEAGLLTVGAEVDTIDNLILELSPRLDHADAEEQEAIVTAVSRLLLGSGVARAPADLRVLVIASLNLSDSRVEVPLHLLYTSSFRLTWLYASALIGLPFHVLTPPWLLASTHQVCGPYIDEVIGSGRPPATKPAVATGAVNSLAELHKLYPNSRLDFNATRLAAVRCDKELCAYLDSPTADHSIFEMGARPTMLTHGGNHAEVRAGELKRLDEHILSALSERNLPLDQPVAVVSMHELLLQVGWQEEADRIAPSEHLRMHNCFSRTMGGNSLK